MADSVVYWLLDDMAYLLKHEASMLRGHRTGDQIKSLYDELKQIDQFLHDSKGKREMVEDLVSSIQRVAEEAEYVIDTFVVNVAEHRRGNTLDKYFRSKQHSTMLGGVAEDIKSIKDKISTVYSRRDEYGIEKERADCDDDDDDDRIVELNRRRSRKFVEDQGPVVQSFNQNKTFVMEKLMNEGCGRREVLSILGMGGVGKTTLVQQICADILVKKRFQCRVWVVVSQKFMYRELLLNILQSVTQSTEEIYKMNEEELAHELAMFLQDKRYFIVLDDVWDSHVWHKLESAFPHNLNGSRILITTRHLQVARHANSICRIRVHDDHGFFEFKSHGQGKLKPCSLYVGVFPQNVEIPARKLIRLWMAEGFVKEEDKRSSSKKLEHVAEDYLEELISQRLIRVVRRRSDGGVKSCHIHYQLRKNSISEGVQGNFMAQPVFKVEELTSSFSSMSNTKPRRLSINCDASRYFSDPPCSSTSRVRSLLFFRDQDVLNIEKFKGFPLLRVLDFGTTIFHKVPPEIERLVHLRYLRMSAPHLREIPSCISNLPKLETLDLRESGIVFFRENFWKMQRLRHLFIFGDCDLPYDRKKEVKTMPNLQTLSTISPQIVNVLDFKTVFPKVTKLGLQSSRYVVGSRLPNFKNVQTLKIIDPFYFRFHLNSFSSSLTKVTLLRTEISSSVFATLGKLSDLQALKLLKKSLVVSHMNCSEGSFPKLQVLHMADLDVTKWTLESGAMKSLEYLAIKNCVELTEIPENLNEATNLRNVNASRCASRLEHSLRNTLGEKVNIWFEFQAMDESGTEEWGSGGGQLSLNGFRFGDSRNL